jgi:hypothetical protein
MIQRLAPGALLVLVSCLVPPPPPSASAPSSGAAAASGECGQFKIKNASDLDACKTKCHDTERDQKQACSGPGCQGGAETKTCVASCDDGAKAAQQAKCYK